MAALQQSSAALREFHRVGSSLPAVARYAEDLKVAPVIRPAAHDRLDVVDVVAPSELHTAPCATALLKAQDVRDVGCRVAPLGASKSSAAVARHYQGGVGVRGRPLARYFPPSLRIFRNPLAHSFYRWGRICGICSAPPFSASFAGVSFAIVLSYALWIGCLPFTGSGFRFLRIGRVIVTIPLSETNQASGCGYIALRDMPALAGLAGKVALKSKSFGFGARHDLEGGGRRRQDGVCHRMLSHLVAGGRAVATRRPHSHQRTDFSRKIQCGGALP